MRNLRVAVIDDHNLFRAGVVELLESAGHVEVIGEGASGVEAIALAHDSRPDVMLLDVEMPGPGAPATVRKVREASTGTRVVILTMHDDPEIVRSLVDAGASGYLLKTAGRSELLAAVENAAHSEDSVLIAVSRRTAATLGRQRDGAACLLSAREVEVLELLASGRSNRDIARTLYISDGTVKRHLANVYAKLTVSSRMAAIRKSIELGIIANPFGDDRNGQRP
jgi:DNA-binding NarL/FixJ family response regulator